MSPVPDWDQVLNDPDKPTPPNLALTEKELAGMSRLAAMSKVIPSVRIFYPMEFFRV